ncbi:uncharacterized protein PHACADRAFT_187961 [Phanerochaete carnosa HHB-10118-sp]|uniref:3'(2'),5'-bisphosphate nucleotidase n=1 Tax=Phanerochaete carnosa (strain HHB-10118-sp) TaxID=650164 RepID=K5VJF1_PHACS|nr:uncharacterized protein PHACADRAFT_187961 [Phanerochaete carnosa HHB-10118-sp]EKM51463.1 hypothetical protein PHACADRAFT_187961 [Phanerochaete carnosa HHB-10118-sp]
MSQTYEAEKQVAIAAVRRACALTASVFNKLAKNETLLKEDESPVTIGDYSAQAVIGTVLCRAFPDDPIVGEEDAAYLRSERGVAMRKRIVELTNEAFTAPLQLGEKEWGLGPSYAQSPEQIMDIIDRGSYSGGRTGRFWTLDPIDGTKGFLRGEQYAVCLALIKDARVELGVMGCPNLPVDASSPDGARGCLFVAARGAGAWQLPLTAGDPGAPVRLTIPTCAQDALNLLEPAEATHSRRSFNERVAELLGITRAPTRMDSQAKYCALARSDGGVYLRIPHDVRDRAMIWDHAPGSVLVEEAGGIITDSRGLPLYFGLGRTLDGNFGVIASGKPVHAQVLEGVKKVMEEELT